MINHRQITSRTGRLLWAADETSPRGAVQTYYTERTAGETSPSAWRVWAPTQRQAIGTEMTRL